MNYVFDAYFLIYFGKLRILDYLTSIKGNKYIPKDVYREVRSNRVGDEEVDYIESIISKGMITIKEPKKIIEPGHNLSLADREVISLAMETNSIAVVDERQANYVAQAYSVKTHGSIYILLELVRLGAITKKTAISYIDKIVASGFFLSSLAYKAILDTIDRMR